MLTKAQINHLKSLKLKKYRQNYDEFIIEGDKLITEALLGNVELRRLVATNQWLASNKIQLPQHLVVETVTEKEMQQISSLSTSPDVLGVMKKMQFDIQSFTPENNWALILDGISDPGTSEQLSALLNGLVLKRLYAAWIQLNYTIPKWCKVRWAACFEQRYIIPICLLF